MPPPGGARAADEENRPAILSRHREHALGLDNT